MADFPSIPTGAGEYPAKAARVIAGPYGPVYVSHFPGSKDIDFEEVFSKPGYNEPAQ